MKKLLTIILVLCSVASFGQMRGGAQYDPGAMRTGNIALAATGTAAAPAYSFSSDPNTGMYSPAADTLAFAEGGAESFRVNSAGEVLIATSTDAGAYRLQNNGCLWSRGYDLPRDTRIGWFSIDDTFTLNGVSTAQNGLTFGPAIGDHVTLAGYYGLNFVANSLERMRITKGGNVLIATSTDDGANKLQVNGFTKLGEAATGVKMKVLTGTTAAAEGGDVTVNHGLASPDKIIDYSILVWIDADTAVPVNCGTEDAGYACYSYIDTTAIKVKLHSTDSENILSKAFVITLWYKE